MSSFLTVNRSYRVRAVMTTDVERADAVADALARVRALAGEAEVTREVLAATLEEVKALAGRGGLWSEAEFPAPDPQERQARYLISEDDDRRFALYLNVMRPGKRIPPHNHTTWACIAGVEGEEHNFVYRRLDDGGEPGRARIEQVGTQVVGPGGGIALLGDDIHSVEIRGDQPIRHLHLYGRALETLTERLTFDEENGTCRVMDIGVRTRR